MHKIVDNLIHEEEDAVEEAVDETREALVKFYMKVDPSKVESGAVDTILGKFRGNEEQMWMLLQRMFPDEDIAAAKSASES